MKTSLERIVYLVLFMCLSTPAFAGGISQHFSHSLDHSVRAIGHSTATGFKLVSGIVSIPLMIAGEIGKASGDVGDALWEEANKPLPITDEIITAGPTPAEAMAVEEEEK